MKPLKKLGIWMDHSDAHLVEYKPNEMKTRFISSDFTHEVKEESLSKSESKMHNKEQQEQSYYYKKLGEVIKAYDDIVLFGPTDAKVELQNMLHEDHHFDNIKIHVEQSDKLTNNQLHAYVKDYFEA